MSILLPGQTPANGAQAFAGWGLRTSGIRAQSLAQHYMLPCWRLEDGFLRSLGLGVTGSQLLSIVVDDVGIYYDATQPSRLERLIADGQLDAAARIEAKRGLALLSLYRLSKYNHAPSLLLPPKGSAKRVLVIDQTYGDVSVRFGCANADTFRNMLATAQRENPTAEIWIKRHPDVVAGKRRGYLSEVPHAAHCLDQDACPQSLLPQFDVVYTATSHMGFEALAAGCKVVCFGMPWYAGWGLTDDRHPEMPTLLQRRRRQCTLEELFHAAYLRYARYIQPETGEPGSFFDVAEWIRLNRELREQASGILWCVGMTLWKRAVVWPFLKSPQNRLRFVRKLPRQLPHDSKVVAWGMKSELQEACRARNIPLLAMEDGFLRSVGLGSHLLPPLSLVVDGGGLYYAYRSDSDLQRHLNAAAPSEEDCLRARQLRARLVSGRISKYNVGSGFQLGSEAAGKLIVLVPGQVEDDASIRLGSPVIHSNLALLQAARAEQPDAWIVYKPHPDVVSGNRTGHIDAGQLAALADQVVENADISSCIAAADEIHTMTSLAGFEALLQGKTVHCHGAPFYAGWGLTKDHIALPERKRRLTLNELVYGALIAYPRYVIPGQAGYARVEAVVDLLMQQKQENKTQSLQTNWYARQWRKAQGLLCTLF
ncbi:capsular polysaccharide biosynthesis protein [Chromobacterium sp. IIBBL 290-4]|uniref:capsular polysaccharide biosynthesis protein n=1 Tax=Chromobacterium sp. IIBBL 290-4 TaxID=2953890 RepID=UPI0020B685DD|nr:capsular polysaccharide biosynthesis protein [Chromobacterium sp. IIBBL 290-4]UTH76245.1 capsular polysaccharide biosynthesis protein [Chromobacterium sp. IIBBL 290-4]